MHSLMAHGEIIFRGCKMVKSILRFLVLFHECYGWHFSISFRQEDEGDNNDFLKGKASIIYESDKQLEFIIKKLHLQFFKCLSQWATSSK